MKTTIILVMAYWANGNLNYSEQWGNYKTMQECRDAAAFYVELKRKTKGVQVHEIMSMCYEVVGMR
jgi:hypothetical protein